MSMEFRAVSGLQFCAIFACTNKNAANKRFVKKADIIDRIVYFSSWYFAVQSGL